MTILFLSVQSGFEIIIVKDYSEPRKNLILSASIPFQSRPEHIKSGQIGTPVFAKLKIINFGHFISIIVGHKMQYIVRSSYTIR